MTGYAQHRSIPRIVAVGMIVACVWLPLCARGDVLPPPPIPEEGAQRAQPLPAPAAAGNTQRDCAKCGVIRTIREVTREKKTGRLLPSYIGSQEYRDTRQDSPALVGPVVGMTFGPGTESRGYVGAMGSQKAQARELETVYEVTVRFDDGRFGLYELTSRENLRVDGRVRALDGTLEPLPK